MLSNGSNLPRLLEGGDWHSVGAKITDSDLLAQYTLDPTLAFFNIRTLGYHFCRVPEPAGYETEKRMTLEEFHQSAAILTALEMSDLVKTGVLHAGDLPAWSGLRANPLRYLGRSDDRTARAIWDAILQRQEMRRSGGNLESRNLTS